MNSNKDTIGDRLKFYLNPFDGRYEDLVRGNKRLNVMRDLTAGLIVAMVAIPLAMGFAMASGLQPEQGIVGGAVAGLLGALFGGSKYQVYGPTAAFIPVIAAIMAKYDHGFLALVSILAGALLMITGLFKFGRIVALVPHSIVVGFTIGIAIVIAFSQIGEVLGLQHDLGYNITEQIPLIILHFVNSNIYAVIIAITTFILCKGLLRVSIFIPAPLIAFAVSLLLAETLFKGKGLILSRTNTEIFQQTFLSSPAPHWRK
jgi:SulP family sulfate permease